MLSRWSDGRLLSNLHRVRMPTRAECNPPKSRYSIAFFAQADKRALIQSEKHEPITAGDYIVGRIRSNYEANMKAKEAKEKAEKAAAKAAEEAEEAEGEAAPKRARTEASGSGS